MGGTLVCQGNYELHGFKLHQRQGRGIRKPKKGRARPSSGRTANRRRRKMSQAWNNARTRERETDGIKKDSGTRCWEKKAKQLLWDFWPLKNSKRPNLVVIFFPTSLCMRFVGFRVWICMYVYRGEIFKYSNDSFPRIALGYTR